MFAAKKFLVGAVAAGALLPSIALAATVSEVHFAPDGTFTATALTVYQKAETNFFVRATWGRSFIRITLVTNPSTVVTRSYGEPAKVDDIQEGHVLDVTGTLNFSGESINITPTKIRDTNLLSAGKNLSGTVKSVDMNARSFVLSNDTFGTTSIRMAEGAGIVKGVRTIYLGDLSVGDKVLSANGTYDYPTNTLSATYVSVYQTPSTFVPRNFQGKLKSLSGTDLPASMVVSVDGTDYRVFLSKDAAVLNRMRAETVLSRFIVGDIVRFYGAIRKADLSQVDAEVIRDLNF